MILLTLGEEPEEDRDVERRRGTAYVTRKGVLRTVSLVAIAMLLGYFTVFRGCKERRDFVVSKDNLSLIHQALYLYAADNGDGLPAAQLPGVKDAAGYPITWANQLFNYEKDKGAFKNPSSPDEADTLLSNIDANGIRQKVSLSYGLLCSTSALKKYEIRDDTRIVCESLSSGVLGSYDPLPLGGRDGFLVGYNNANSASGLNLKSEYATRIAFKSNSGKFKIGDMAPIHPRLGVVALRGDGGIDILSSFEELKVGRRGNVPFGPWVP